MLSAANFRAVARDSTSSAGSQTLCILSQVIIKGQQSGGPHSNHSLVYKQLAPDYYEWQEFAIMPMMTLRNSGAEVPTA